LHFQSLVKSLDCSDCYCTVFTSFLAPHFDTLQFTETLQSAGFIGAQAAAEAEALSRALTESFVQSIASKDDVHALKAGIHAVRMEITGVYAELRLIKWGVLLPLGIAVPGAIKSLGVF